MTLNRKIAPKLGTLDSINYTEQEEKKLGKTPFYTFLIPGSQVIQMDFVFSVGFRDQNQPLVTNYAFNLLLSGTENKNSTEINEALDSLGAYTSMKVDLNHSVFTVYSTQEAIISVLNILMPVINKVNYPDKDLIIQRNEWLNSYKINQTKTGYNAKKAMQSLLYGEKSPLGYAVTEEDHKNISRGTLQEFHRKHLGFENCFVVLSTGNLDILNSMEPLFLEYGTNTISFNHNLEYSSSRDYYKFVQVDNAVQSAVRVSKFMVPPSNTDYHKINFVNTLLGGYFGSRLMSNIREEKGLTYGIHSSLTIHGDQAVFTIATEVKGDKHKECLSEIDKEIRKLQTEKVSENELNTVKNYTLGLITKNISKVTNHNNRFISLQSKGLDYNHPKNYIKTINEITADDVLAISNTYLQASTLYRVVATNEK